MSQSSVSKPIGFYYCPVCKMNLPHYTRNSKRDWKSRTIWCDRCKTVRLQFKNGDNGIKEPSDAVFFQV